MTPGKLGEAVKALLLRESRGIPAARTAPIVVAERLTDLGGLLLLAAVGAFTFDVDRTFLIAATVLIVAGLVVVSIEPLARGALRLVVRVPGLARLSGKLDEFYESTAALLRPVPLLLALRASRWSAGTSSAWPSGWWCAASPGPTSITRRRRSSMRP